MTSIKNIISFTETFAPLKNAMDFDNCGLLIGNKNTKVKKVLVCLDITKEVVAEAVEKQAQLIISHHPVIFTGLKSISDDSIPYLLVQNNLCALCLHTNLDLSKSFGVNTCLCDALKLKDVKYFMDKDKELCLAVGKISKPLTEEAFASFVKEKLFCKGLRLTQLGNKIKTVAVSSGSGGSEIYNAKAKGADVLVTGEIKHNQILEANHIGLSIVDVGHFKSENVVVSPLAEKLQKEFPKTDFIISDNCSDFVNYM